MNARWTSPRPRTVKASCFGLGNVECAQCFTHAVDLIYVFAASKTNVCAFAAAYRSCFVWLLETHSPAISIKTQQMQGRKQCFRILAPTDFEVVLVSSFAGFAAIYLRIYCSSIVVVYFCCGACALLLRAAGQQAYITQIIYYIFLFNCPSAATLHSDCSNEP